MPPIKTDSTSTKSKNPRRDLNAASATIILLAYLATEVFCVVLIAAIAIAIALSQGTYNPDRIFKALDKLMPALTLAIPVLGGIATVLMSSALVPNHLKDTSPNGAAWVRGSWRAIAQGFAIGVFVGACTYVLGTMLQTHVDDRNVAPMTRMALTPGLLRLISGLTVLLFAPLVEELLFRGVLYGGYRKSFGPIWAAVLTTSLFLLLHLPGMTHPIPTLVGVIGFSAVALWCRLRAAAIGPAIAVHVGCNSWSMFLVLFG